MPIPNPVVFDVHGVGYIINYEPDAEDKVANDQLAYHYDKLVVYSSNIYLKKGTKLYNSIPHELYPDEWFILVKKPDKANGEYRVCGSVGGSFTIKGDEHVIESCKY